MFRLFNSLDGETPRKLHTKTNFDRLSVFLFSTLLPELCELCPRRRRPFVSFALSLGSPLPRGSHLPVFTPFRLSFFFSCLQLFESQSGDPGTELTPVLWTSGRQLSGWDGRHRGCSLGWGLLPSLERVSYVQGGQYIVPGSGGSPESAFVSRPSCSRVQTKL